MHSVMHEETWQPAQTHRFGPLLGELDHRKNREYVRVVPTCDQARSTWS
jgi:hypothetical protein